MVDSNASPAIPSAGGQQPGTLLITIRTPQDILLQEEVRAVSSFNDKGFFDVLPEHAYFISLVKKYIVIHEKSGEKRQIEITDGIIHVEENRVHVYLE